MINVVVNGGEVVLDDDMTLMAYLESRDLAERRVAVAVNGEIVRRPDYGSTVIQPGDRIEIVRPAGGG